MGLGSFRMDQTMSDFTANVDDVVGNPDHVRAINIFSRNDITVEVPLKFEGRIVGKAKVLPNGNIECDFNNSTLGRILRDRMVEGIIDNIDLVDRLNNSSPIQGSVGLPSQRSVNDT